MHAEMIQENNLLGMAYYDVMAYVTVIQIALTMTQVTGGSVNFISLETCLWVANDDDYAVIDN